MKPVTWLTGASMMPGVLYRFFRKALWILALVLTFGIFLLNVFYTSEVASTGYEIVNISQCLLRSIPMLVIIVCAAVIISGFQKTLEKTDEKKLFHIFTLIYSVLALYLIFNVDTVLRADAKTVFSTALEAKEGIYSAFRPGYYMYRYPHQLGLMLYDQILTAFSENPQFAFFVNFLLVLGINHTSWKISDELFHDKLTNVLTILLSFAFLPQIFFILFVYGLIPGFFFMLLGFYCALRYTHTEDLKAMLGMLLCVAVAVVLKQNFLIGGIAIGIFLFLQLLKDKKIRLLAVLAALALSMTVPGNILKLWYGYQAEVELNNASPSILWIAMGTDIDNHMRGPGWYDSSGWNLYNAAAYDAELASELGRQKLLENWNKIQREPGRAGQFFLDKTISQWCDPMYESVWSGPLEDCGQYTHTEILESLYTGGTWADAVAGYLKLLCLALWAYAAAFLLMKGNVTAGWEPMYLYFIGGLLFHTFWEGKSQYTYPYLFVLIPFAAFAVRRIITGRRQ